MSSLHPLQWADRSLEIEIEWLNPKLARQPLLVFLHEGLGSVGLWRDFPMQLCDALGCRGLVYSRPGYGQSSPRPEQEQWGSDFLHRQAYELLPALLASLGIDAARQPLWLLGHSDGASIALLFAARHPNWVSACVAMAPHVCVEEVSISSIEAARNAYLHAGLKPRLAPYHRDVDSAFWGWNQAWLNPAFRDWNITQDIANATCSVLALQGIDDEYGTLDQIDQVARVLPQTQRMALAQCRHSPHRDQPDQTLQLCQSFFLKEPFHEPLLTH